MKNINEKISDLKNRTMTCNDSCLFCLSKNITRRISRFVPFLEERMFLFEPKDTYIVHCNNCDISYSSYRPNDEEMARLYSGYRDENYQKQRQKYEPSYTKEFNENLGHNSSNVISRKKFLESIVKRYVNTDKIKKVLDYGGDSGQFIPDCFSGADKYVYEVSNVPTVDGVKNISEKEIESNPDFDFVMCCHVLEHVTNPIEVIYKLISYCKNDGYIYIEVPYETVPFAGNYIHEHINVYRTKTFIKLWNIFGEIDIIDTAMLKGRIYVLIKKRKIPFVLKLVKIIKFRIKNKLLNFINIEFLNKIKIAYILSK